MKLYKITLGFRYEYRQSFTFLVVAENTQKAELTALETFKSYDYGDCNFKQAEVIAEEGQYGKPNILLIEKKATE